MTTRFTDDELDVVRDAATAAELTVAAFCGLAALAAARQQRLNGPVEPSATSWLSFSASCSRPVSPSTGQEPTSTRRSPRSTPPANRRCGWNTR